MIRRCTILLPGLAAAFIQAADWEGATVKEERLDVFRSTGDAMRTFAVSATRNGCRVAKVEGSALDGFAVRVDGVVGPRWSEVAASSPVFSPDGSSVAYCARRGLDWRWVVNGKEGPAFPEMTATSFAFSEDGKRHACIAIPGFRRTVLVVDGVPGPEIGRDKPQPWDAAPVFSGDGKRLAHVEALHEQKLMRVNVDGKPGPWHRGISMAKSPAFGAYSLNAMQSSLAEAPQRPVIFPIVFSRDGEHFAYGADLGGEWTVVMDGVPGPSCEATGFDLVLTPDGSDHAYMFRRAGERFIHREKGGPLPVEVINDWTLTFSPDGKHLAFAGVRGGTQAVWLDGQSAPCDIPVVSMKNFNSIRFSPDSRRLAFVIEGPGKSLHWVVDGKAGPGTTLAFGQFDFSPDSRHFAYFLPRPEQKDVAIVVDGKVCAAHAVIASGPAFRHDGTLEFLALKDDGLFRIQVTGY